MDTVGAGDAFAGAFTVASTSGMPLKEAIHFANAAGALATQGGECSLQSRNAMRSLRSWAAKRGHGGRFVSPYPARETFKRLHTMLDHCLHRFCSFRSMTAPKKYYGRVLRSANF